MFVFVEGSGTLRDLPELTHSFPTRGASVLLAGRAPALSRLPAPGGRGARAADRWQGAACGPTRRSRADLQSAGRRLNRRVGVEACRSEEHTTELQSLMRISYAVFCLKKKNNHATQLTHIRRYNNRET